MSRRLNPAPTSITQQNGCEIGFRHHKKSVFCKSMPREKVLKISVTRKGDRETVSKIVRGPEMQEYVRTMRERFYTLGGDAISAIQHTLQQENDGRLGFQVLASIGVIPSPEERQLLAASLAARESDEEAEDAGVKRVMAELIEIAIERASLFGHRVPKLEEDLKKAGGKINYSTGKIEPLKKQNAT